MAQLVVGLDIGTSAVRAAELDVSHSRPVLLTYGQVGLPPASLVDGEIRDGSAVTEALRRLWANGHFSSSSVIVGIAGLRAITREIDLPFVPDNEVDSAVRFQSEEVIPFPPEQTILSSQVLADYTSPEGDKMRRVLVAAAHIDLVNGVIEAVDQAGLAVAGVDLISSALVRAIGGHEETAQPEAIVSVGAGVTVVVIHQQGRPQFVRTIGSGGNATTAAISAALDVPIVDAEGMKRRIGESNSQLQPAERAAQASMVELVGEIRNSIQYFASLPGRLPVSKVLVTGGGSALAGLIPMLQAQTNLPVLTVSPLARLDTSKLELTEAQVEEVRPVLATPIGLALPEPDKAVKKFNLLPPEVVQRARLKRIKERTLIGCAAVVVLLLAFGMWKLLQVHNAQNNVSALQSDINTLNAQVPKYDQVVAANDAYTAGLARRASVLNSAVDWPLALNNLISITPPGAQVKTFNGTSTANGTSSGGTAGSGAGSTSGTGSATGASGASGAPTSAAIGTIQLAGDGPRAEPLDLGGMDQRRRQLPAVRQPAARGDDGGAGLVHRLPLHRVGHPQRQPLQEREPQVNAAREYRVPLLIGAGTVVVALLLWVALIAPQNSKLSNLAGPADPAADPAGLAAVEARHPPDRAAEALGELRRPAEDQHPDPERADPDRHRRRGVLVREPVQRPHLELGGDPHPVQRLRSGLLHLRLDDSDHRPVLVGVTGVGLRRRRRRGDGRADHRGGDRQLRTGAGLRQRSRQLPSPVRDPDLRAGLRGGGVGEQRVLGGQRLLGQQRGELGSGSRCRPALDRRGGDGGLGRALQPRHHRVDLLHLAAERPGGVHQGHRRRQELTVGRPIS